MNNITETAPNVKASVPVPSTKEMTLAQMDEDILVKMPRGLASFLADDLELLSKTALTPNTPTALGFRSIGWILAASILKKAITQSFVKSATN